MISGDPRPAPAATGSPAAGDPRLQALLLADHIYRDGDSGKFVIAGTFHRMQVAGFPSTFGRSIGLFAVLTGVGERDDLALDIEFLPADGGEALMRSELRGLAWHDASAPFELAVEVPPPPLPRPGPYLFRLSTAGRVLGDARVEVVARDPEPPDAAGAPS